MQICLLDELKRWFKDYANSFFGQDDYVDTHLEIKREHTWRTCEEILCLAERLSLSENERRIAETTALFHDVGRFPQFTAYRTFNDGKSVNHCCLGVDVLNQEGILERLEPDERLWIETAVALHGRKSVPEDLDSQSLLFLQMIRDADKLDIFRFTVSRYRDGRNNRGIVLDFPDSPGVSSEVLDAVLSGRLMEYTCLRNLNDFKLCQIGWVYDVNFASSLERLRASRLLDEMFTFLPDTPEIDEVRQTIDRHIAARIAAG